MCHSSDVVKVSTMSYDDPDRETKGAPHHHHPINVLVFDGHWSVLFSFFCKNAVTTILTRHCYYYNCYHKYYK